MDALKAKAKPIGEKRQNQSSEKQAMKKNTYRDDLTPQPNCEQVVALNDPKYAFIDGRIYSINGGYWIPKDEPVIVFRGKDQASVSAVLGYIECLKKQDQTNHVIEHIKTATERLDAIIDFQLSHPEFTGIGCGIDEKLKTI